MGDDHVFVGVGDLAGIPGRQSFREGHIGQLLDDVGCGRAGIDEAFQQRITGHAVGAVQAGETGFADGVKAWYVGAALFVDHHAATCVMRGRHHRDRLLGDVDGKLKAALIDRREMGLDEFCRFMADVQVDAINAQALHLMVDSAGHDVSRRQFGPRIEALHEALAVWQF